MIINGSPKEFRDFFIPCQRGEANTSYKCVSFRCPLRNIVILATLCSLYNKCKLITESDKFKVREATFLTLFTTSNNQKFKFHWTWRSGSRILLANPSICQLLHRKHFYTYSSRRHQLNFENTILIWQWEWKLVSWWSLSYTSQKKTNVFNSRCKRISPFLEIKNFAA